MNMKVEGTGKRNLRQIYATSDNWQTVRIHAVYIFHQSSNIYTCLSASMPKLPSGLTVVKI